MIYKIQKCYSENDKLSLLIRHAERNHIPDNTFGNEVLLNKNGILNAIKFGNELSNLKLNKILTSPIGRCIQTAENIAKGYGKHIDIEETIALGAPGLHITNEAIANIFFLEQGFEEMYHRYINDIPIPGMLDAQYFNKLQTNFLVENTTEKGLTIFISHDMQIAYYHYSINKTIYTKENWIKYLSGLIIKNGKYMDFKIKTAK